MKILLVIVALFAVCQAQIVKIPLNVKVHDESTKNKNAYMRNLEKGTQIKQKVLKKKNLYYVGQVNIGKEKKSMSLLFDTTTSLSWIPSPECISKSKCQGFVDSYICKSSDECATNQQSLNDQAYKNGTLSGQSIDVSTSFSGFKAVSQNFIQTQSINSLSYLSVDGVLGMQMFSFYKPNENGFISKLYENGQISNNMFSFYFGSTPQLTLGGFDVSSVQKANNIYYHNVIMNGKNDNSQQWVIKGSQIQVGQYTEQFAQGNNLIQISTADPFIQLSGDLFDNTMKYFVTNYKVVKQGTQYTLPCDQSFPNFILQLPDSEGKTQIYNLTSNFFIHKYKDICYLMIADLGNQQNVKVALGTPFLEKYVSIFSINNKTIGFSEAAIETSDDYFSFPSWAIALIVIGCIIVVVLVLFFICQKKIQNKDRELSAAESNTSSIITYSQRLSFFDQQNISPHPADTISTNQQAINTNNQVISSKNQQNGGITVQILTNTNSSKQTVSSQQTTSTSSTSNQITTSSNQEIQDGINY